MLEKMSDLIDQSFKKIFKNEKRHWEIDSDIDSIGYRLSLFVTHESVKISAHELLECTDLRKYWDNKFTELYNLVYLDKGIIK